MLTHKGFGGKGRSIPVRAPLGVARVNGPTPNPSSPPRKGEVREGKSDIVCFHCRKPGHKISECFALKRGKHVKPVSLAIPSLFSPVVNVPAENKNVKPVILAVPSPQMSIGGSLAGASLLPDL